LDSDRPRVNPKIGEILGFVGWIGKRPAASLCFRKRLVLTIFIFHDVILPEPAKNKKPTVGFLARFFLG
jgi:hypothetical protein